MGEGDSRQSVLKAARALLRVARDRTFVDPDTGKLATKGATLADLEGRPTGKGPPRRRSFSTYALCSQTLEDIMNTARALAKEDDCHREPKGAAATFQALLAIDYLGAPALETFEETDASDRPGHIGIRFSDAVRDAREDIRSMVRERLINAFGQIRPVVDLYQTHCS